MIYFRRALVGSQDPGFSTWSATSPWCEHLSNGHPFLLGYSGLASHWYSLAETVSQDEAPPRALQQRSSTFLATGISAPMRI